MAGPGGTVIGRISVKVLPDTSDFKEKLRAELEKIERQVKGEITLHAKLDDTGLRRNILETVRKINAEIKGKDVYKVKLGAQVDGSRASVAKAIREIQARAKAEGKKIKLDATLVGGNVTLELDKESLKRIQDEIDHFKRKNDPIKIKVEFNYAELRSKEIAVKLAILTRARFVDIIPRLNKGAYTKVGTALAALSGGRVLADWIDDLVDGLGRLDRKVPIITALAEGLAGVSAWGTAAVSNMFVLGASIASMAGASLALPGIFAGLGVGIGITVIALKDMKKQLPDVYAQFAKMAQTIRTDFWSGARKGIHDLAMVYMPHLAAAADDVGKFWGQFAEAISKPFHTALGEMFDNLVKSIRIMNGGVNVFAGIITTLGTQGSKYLPQLANWFVRISTTFNNWLSQAANDGRFQGWVDTGIAAIHDFGRVLSNFGGILAGVAHAAEAGGGSTLGMLADTLGRIKKVVQGTNFQAVLTDAFASAHKAMSQLASESGPAVERLFTNLGLTLQKVLPLAGQAIGAVVGAIADALASPAIQNGLTTLFGQLADALNTVTPLFKPLATALSAMAPVVGELAVIIARLAVAAFTPLAAVIAQIAPLLPPLIAMLGTALLQAITAVAGVLPQIVAAFTTLISGGVIPAVTTALAALVPVFAQLVVALAPVVAALVVSLAPVLPALALAFGQLLIAVAPLVVQFLQFATTAVIPLVTAFVQMAVAALPQVIAALIAVVAAVTPVVTAFMGLVQFLEPVLMPVIRFVFQFVVDFITSTLNAVANVFNGVTKILSGTLSAFKDLFTGNWKGLWNDVKKIASGVWDVIKGAFILWLNFTMARGLKIGIDALKALWKVGWDAIKLSGQVAWVGIKAAFTNFLSALASAPRYAVSILKQLFSDLWASVKLIFTHSFGQLKSATSDGISGVLSIVRSLPGRISGSLGSLGGILRGAGASLIQGFIDGIASMIGKVKSTLGGITSKLTSWKGPPSTDATILIGAGQLVIEGFIKGLESRYDDAKKSLQGFTKDIEGTQFKAPSVQVAHSVNGALPGGGGSIVAQKVLNYYAAPGSSINKEEDLFTAASRARMMDW